MQIKIVYIYVINDKASWVATWIILMGASMISDHVAKRFHIYGVLVLDHSFISYNLTSTFLNSGYVRKLKRKRNRRECRVGPTQWNPQEFCKLRPLILIFTSLFSTHLINFPVTPHSKSWNV